MKNMLSVDEQITNMRNKGIRFETMTEAEAREYLYSKNFFFNVVSFRGNYQKYGEGHQLCGKYQNLDFAYLVELNEIDNELRNIIFELCLVIEKNIKIKLISSATENDTEDGYDVIKKFFSDDRNFRVLKSIHGHKSGRFCKDLIEKYYPYFPIWVIVELISFSDLCHITKFYDDIYSTEILLPSVYMNTVRDFRNACAHGNCLLSNITKWRDTTKRPDARIVEFTKDTGSELSDTAKRKYFRREFPYDFITLLYVFDHYAPYAARQRGLEKLMDLTKNRMMMHADYFNENQQLVGTYHFLNNIIDNLAKKA